MVSVPVVIALGIWGFLEVPVVPRFTTLEATYRAVRLYTLDFGPHVGDSSPRPNIQLWVALLLAGLLVLRGLIAVLRSTSQRAAMRHLLRGHLVVCGGAVHGARLVAALAAEHDVVLLDHDPQALRLRVVRGEYEWRLVGDGVRAETLLAAGVQRAHWVIAVTGDDFVNSQIVSAISGLSSAGRLRTGVRVFVQVENPAIARFLEEESASEDVEMFVSSFSTNAVAAERLIDNAPVAAPSAGRRARQQGGDHGGEAGRGSGPGSLLEMRDGRAPNLLLAGDHPLIDTLVLTALRRWRVRWLSDTEANASYVRPPIHLSVVGPGAVERVERLRRQWQPEAHLAVIEARDTEPGGESGPDVERWLEAADRADGAIVACQQELEESR